ncbi:MAG: hypothetical protein C4289_11790, partial [Chloroflexota bacterium]
QGRIIAITGEAGMGKTRLVAEVVRLARARGFEVYSGECQSYGANSAYLVWHDIWRAFFGLDEREAASHQVWKLESELARMEEKIRYEEARAAAQAELAKTSLEEQFAALERDDTLEDELRQLKQKMGKA